MTLKKTLLFLSLVLVTVTFYYLYLRYKSNLVGSLSTSIPTESTAITTPEEIKIINEVKNYQPPAGEQIYNISHGNKVEGPKASKIIYNPLATMPGDNQTVTVIFPESEIVNSAIIFFTTDHLENQKLILKKAGKINSWTGTWTVSDTIKTRYNARLYFVGPSGTYNTVSTFL